MKPVRLSRSPALSADARHQVEVINADPIIGSRAPGDGDIFDWHESLLWLMLIELREICPPVAWRTADDELPRVAALRKRQPVGTRIGYRRLRRHLFAYSWLFLHAYCEPTEAQMDLWSSLMVALELEFENEWGGRRIHLHKRSKPQSDPKSVIAQALREGLPLAQAFSRAGVSRATGYRILALRTKKAG
jgi:hypothetical protein